MKNTIYPFKFLDSYTAEDKEIFFGREEEVDQLYQMIYQSDTLLLYGASGTGKTSLIQCGLASRFQQHDWLEAFVRRNKNINESLNRALIALGGQREDSSTAVTEDLDWLDDIMGNETLHTTTKVLTTTQQYIKNIYLKHFRPIYLIFDQFEELFILGSQEEQTQFIATIKEILQVEQPVKLIFSIREEYLGSLYEFERVVPELLRKKLRIDPMNLEKVKAVVLGATASPKSIVHIKEVEAEAIAEQVFEKIRGEDNTLTIQLPYLQVFLDKYYRHISKDKAKTPITEATFTLAALEEIGDIGNILRDFLDEQIIEIANEQLCDHQTIWKILSPFVTVDGTKEPIALELLNKQLPDTSEVLIKHVVFALVNNRILRHTEEEDLYEVAHDSLALRIAEKRSDEEIHLLEVRNLIKSQSQLKDETRELFSEKQLTFIAPFLNRLSLSKEELLLIEESKEQVAAQQKIDTRNKILTGATLLLVFIIIGIFALSSQHQKRIAEKASARNQKILDAMDFYDDKYALAFNNGKYGFINKDGRVLIDYEYDKGEPFDPETGFAKMEMVDYTGERPVDIKYLIDTNDNKYRFVNVIEELGYAGKLNTIFSKQNVQWIKSNLPNDNDRSRLMRDIGQIHQEVTTAEEKLFTTLQKENNKLALNFFGLDKKATLKILNILAEDPTIKEKVVLLFLEGVELDSIPNSIASFDKLAQLDMSFTAIDTLPTFLGELKYLTALNLTATPIKRLPNSITQLQHLKELNLSSTAIDILPVAIGELKELNSLNINGTFIKSLPSSMAQLSKLEHLDCSYTFIDTVPFALGSLDKLTRLNLSGTRLKTFPSSIIELARLKYLDLSSTMITVLPASFGQLEQLTELHLYDTKLTTLPNSFSQLQQLEHLQLNNTGIDALPSSFGNLKKLTFLSLGATKLKTLPNSFSELEELEYLYLNGTSLEKLPNSVFELKQLTKLDLSSTTIDELPAALRQLTKLTQLDLGNTSIKKLPNSIGQLTHLKRLVAPEALEKFPPKFFNLTQLEALVTMATTMKEGDFSQLEGLKELVILGDFSSFPSGIVQLPHLTDLTVHSNRELLVLPDWTSLSKLNRLTYFLHVNEHYDANKKTLSLLQQQLPNCNLTINNTGLSELEKKRIEDVGQRQKLILEDNNQ